MIIPGWLFVCIVLAACAMPWVGFYLLGGEDD